MTKFIHMQSIVNYRIPIKEDGTLGAPQVTSKWTKDMNAPKKKVKKQTKIEDSSAEVGEVEF